MKNVPFYKLHIFKLQALCAIAFAVILSALFSCAKEELDYGKLNLVGELRPITANAVLPKSAESDKTTIGSDGNVEWENTDTIIVNGSPLNIESIVSSTLAIFTGEAGKITSTHSYWASYPASLNATDYSPASIKVALPTTQTYSAGGRIPNYMVAYAVSEDPENIQFCFKNLCSIIKIPVKAEGTGNAAKLKKIEIVSDHDIAGTATAAMPSDNTSSLTFSEGSKKIALECGNTDVSSTKTFSIILPAGTHKLTMKFYDANGKYMKKTMSGTSGSGVSIARSRIYELGTVDFNATESAALFSVSSSQKVMLAPGNLQYNMNTTSGATKWRFAEHQYDVIGEDNITNIVKTNATSDVWIDLFGWGTSGYNGKYPYMTSGTSTEYGDGKKDIAGTNYDWGTYNDIKSYDGTTTYPKGTWRTLTKDEWSYLLGTTTGSRGGDNPTWWIYSRVCLKLDASKSVTGIIVYPDGVTDPSSCANSIVKNGGNYDENIITPAEFAALEAVGCAFLPGSGHRNGSESVATKDLKYGFYWSSSYYTSNNTYAHYCYMNATNLVPASGYPRSQGLCVRLAQNANSN